MLNQVITLVDEQLQLYLNEFFPQEMLTMLEDQHSAETRKLGKLFLPLWHMHHKLQSKIGSGSSGTVYNGIVNWHKASKKQVRHCAIKFLKIDSKKSAEDIRLAIKELENNVRVPQHLNIATVDRMRITPWLVFTLTEINFIYFVTLEMELYKCSLEKWLEQRKCTPRFSTESVFITWQIAQGLKCLHDNDIVHGDLHDGNVLIQYYDSYDSYSVAKIVDFGDTRIKSVVHPQTQEKRRRSRSQSSGTQTKASDIEFFGEIMACLLSVKQSRATIIELLGYVDSNVRKKTLQSYLCEFNLRCPYLNRLIELCLDMVTGGDVSENERKSVSLECTIVNAKQYLQATYMNLDKYYDFDFIHISCPGFDDMLRDISKLVDEVKSIQCLKSKLADLDIAATTFNIYMTYIEKQISDTRKEREIYVKNSSTD